MQRGKDSPPQAIQHPVAFLLKQEVSLVCHWGRYSDFPSAYARENTSIISSTSSLPARGALLWRAAWENEGRILYRQGWKWWHLGLLPSWEHPQLRISARVTSLNPLCIWTKLPATSKRLSFFTPLLCYSAFLVLWSRDREKWDGSQLKFAGTHVIYRR